MPAASVIIPAHNAARTIGATLDGLARQDFEGDFEVIVVDDGSSDDTAAVVDAAGVEARLLRQGQAGPGAARNHGVHEAAGEVLAFVDADCVPTTGWLRAGVAALARADLVQGAAHPDPAAARTPFDRSLWVTGESGLYECASLFVTREAFERAGGFEDWLGARLGKELAEDAWLGWRARRAGARTAFSAEALVHHAVFPRDAAAYVWERARLVYFPSIAKKMPELRRHLLFARVFLNARSAAFDLALAAGVAALFGVSPVVLAAAAPYLWLLVAGALRWRLRAPLVVPVDLCADLVGFGALALGSVRAGSPVL